MEILRETSAKKALLLEACRNEVLVLASPALAGAWDREVRDALKACAARGVRVRVLLEPGFSPRLPELALEGAEVRQVPRRLTWLWRPARRLQAELWIFDRTAAFTGNERARAASPDPVGLELELGTEAAAGLATWFDRRWSFEADSLAYSVRNKDCAFHSGRRAELEFFGCLVGAQRAVTISLPGGKLSRRVAAALRAALREGISVTIYANADRDDGPGLRRLRRLADAGAVVKVCGRGLRSEAAVIDGRSIYLGSLPAAWASLRAAAGPVFVMENSPVASSFLEALETQVSLELNAYT